MPRAARQARRPLQQSVLVYRFVCLANKSPPPNTHSDCTRNYLAELQSVFPYSAIGEGMLEMSSLNAFFPLQKNRQDVGSLEQLFRTEESQSRADRVPKGSVLVLEPANLVPS